MFGLDQTTLNQQGFEISRDGGTGHIKLGHCNRFQVSSRDLGVVGEEQEKRLKTLGMGEFRFVAGERSGHPIRFKEPGLGVEPDGELLGFGTAGRPAEGVRILGSRALEQVNLCVTEGYQRPRASNPILWAYIRLPIIFGLPHVRRTDGGGELIFPSEPAQRV